ncbi:MAG: hypothetical protein ACRD1X_03770 [Vicinamibacteria bacterium]
MSLTRSMMVILFGLMAYLFLPGPAQAQKFYPDDPIREDRDDLPIDKPGALDLSATYDVIENSFVNKVEGPIPRAMNVNTIGDVPDSSWFTNRIGVRPMSIEELVRGPNQVGGPDLSEPVTVISAKIGGITPGLVVRDRRGNVYYVKFDPRAHANLTTAADVSGTLFFYAIGYSVPENHITYFRFEDFTIEPGAEVTLPGGRKALLDRNYIASILEGSAQRDDGSIRAVASLAVPGEPLGSFKFYGTRPDDPNDIFPHEHRRELRGYRVFCAWLHHDDSRAVNTFDAFSETEDGRGHVRHYLIDFGSILGSGSDVRRSIAPQDPRAGNEYLFEIPPMYKTAYTFGIWERPWMNVLYTYPQYPEIGRIESDFFQPDTWKPEYPNAAFDRMLPDDAFWAAEIVASFSDEAVRAIVHQGDYRDPEAERFLADTIIVRRDKVVAHYFMGLNPLDAFRVVGSDLEFRNLGEERGLASTRSYEYEWFVFDNDTSAVTPLTDGASAQPHLAIPASNEPYLMVRIRTRSESAPKWGLAVEVYLRHGTEGRSLVGVEREVEPISP